MKFNTDGELIEPEFHDGDLTGLRMVDKTLKLYLATKNKEKFILSIPNVRRLKVHNFLEGNIVFDLTIYNNPEVFEKKLMLLHGYNEEQAKKYIPINLREITEHQLSFFELGSSYGCELLALFSGTIQIESESEKLDAIAV
jgi:hypothetical protein